jgi:hypothetical protein
VLSVGVTVVEIFTVSQHSAFLSFPASERSWSQGSTCTVLTAIYILFPPAR